MLELLNIPLSHLRFCSGRQLSSLNIFDPLDGWFKALLDGSRRALSVGLTLSQYQGNALPKILLNNFGIRKFFHGVLGNAWALWLFWTFLVFFFFPPQILDSFHTCPDQYSAKDSRGTLLRAFYLYNSLFQYSATHIPDTLASPNLNSVFLAQGDSQALFGYLLYILPPENALWVVIQDSPRGHLVCFSVQCLSTIIPWVSFKFLVV